MAPASNKFRVVFLTLAVMTVSMSLMDASQTNMSVTRQLGRRIRNPRQSRCQDGEYQHKGRTCCRCPAGYRVMRHCENNPNDGECDACGSETFSSEPNNQEECERCTSCNQPNANLEVAVPCTSVQNAKCQCKKDHYCSSSTDTCRLCQPCDQCDANGIKVHCSSTKNTICNEKANESNPGMIAGIIVTILIILAVIGFVMYRKMRKSRSQPTTGIDESADKVELPLLRDIEPCVPDIADVLGWADMQELAIRSGISQANIDSCKLDNPGDSKQQTFCLLMMWVQQHGSRSSERLLEMLQSTNKRGKAEKVKNILRAPQ